MGTGLTMAMAAVTVDGDGKRAVRFWGDDLRDLGFRVLHPRTSSELHSRAVMQCGESGRE